MLLNKPCFTFFAVCFILCVVNQVGEAYIRDGRMINRHTLEALISQRNQKMQSDEGIWKDTESLIHFLSGEYYN